MTTKASRLGAEISILLLTSLVVGWYLYLSCRQFQSGHFYGDFAALWQSLHNCAVEGRPTSSFNLSVHEYTNLTRFEEMGTFPGNLDDAHQFGIHAHFYLYPLSVLSLIFASPYLLLVLQALFYGGFVYLLGKRGLQNGISLLPLLLLLLHFAVSPFSLGLILNDFHFDSFAGLAVGTFALFIMVESPSWISLLVWGILAVMIKESFVALLVGGGLCLMLSGRRNLVKGAALVALGAVSFIFLTKFFIPHFSANKSFLFSGIYGSRLGDSFEQILGTCIRHPGLFLSELFSGPNRNYLLQLVLSCSLVAWFSPRAALLGAGFLFVNLVSSNASMKIPWGQYSAVIVCAMHLAAVEGYAPASRLLTKWTGWVGRWVILPALLLTPLVSAYVYNPLKGQIWAPFFTAQEYTYIRGLPRDLKICSDDRMANFVADRKSLYLFPMKLGQSDVVLLSGDLSTKPWYPTDAVWNASVAYLKVHYTTIFVRNGLAILKRNNLDASRLPPSGLKPPDRSGSGQR